MATQTPKYAAFRAELDEKLIPFLNALEHSYARRKAARAQAKVPTTNLETARRDYLQFGHFDATCGPTYTMEYEDALAKVEEWIPAKIRAEKYHKLCQHKFLEAGGTQEQLNFITEQFVIMHQ